MSTVEEIESAIQALPQAEREKLIKDLPSILPELAVDTEWGRILSDPRPRPALARLGDEIEAQIKSDPECFPRISERDFGP